ncbi:Putative receptor protein kinase ZmPK1 [Morus notabilis]|uniref:Receptor-like serine/threonine-protein kinase n=1 Tax=Morus notabilis TaxID=981085 RepID=W9RGD7_9ROSA|nr:putative receptor protein kinase ZmPK1 [Morus notabilis]EXB89238.1 Putative receptor protein kinase ZmPK1 [Morus notabilis]
MGSTPFSFITFFLLSLCFPHSSSESSSLQAGSSLSVENPADVLISQNRVFSAGFFQVGHNAYCFAIWFTEPSQGHDLTVVWMANREEPVNGRRSKLLFRRSGNLVLRDAGQSVVWSSDSSTASSYNSAAQLQLQDNGNLVLSSLDDVVLWQSFASPTDTLLPGQSLTKDTKLVSSRSQTSYSSGFYTLFFDDDNVLRLLYRSPERSSIYWPDPWLLPSQAGRSIFNDSRIAKLDSLGNFSASDTFRALASDYGTRVQRRLTVEPDGDLRLYSRKLSGAKWIVTWEAVLQPCKIHGICGANSLCTYVPEFGRKCSCIPGYKMINPNDWTQGCEPDFKLSCPNSTTEFAGFAYLPNVEYYGYDYKLYGDYTLERCKAVCLELCDSCVGFHYKYDNGGGRYNCYAKMQLRNGYHTPGFDGDIYLKLPKTILSSLSNMTTNDNLNLDCSSSSNDTVQLDRKYTKTRVSGLLKFLLCFASGVGGLEVIVIFMVWFFVIRSHEKSGAGNMQGYMLAATGFRKFSYAELKKATRGFSEEIGRGAGGIVYKAVLSDNRVAAVKKLKDTSQGEVEFLAEVSTIGRLNHMNLIEMWGYCAEGKHRILVYEYMEHGSLAENLASNVLDWKKRFEIALGTAKGLAYLHDECLEWILHCDIKPQNILLGSNYQPKVADFGLSKLLNRGELGKYSSFSRIRGTRGYMAPEWVYNLPITSKVDVYSYGIVVLEILTGNNPMRGVHDSEDIDGDQARPKMLVTWVREKMVGGALSTEAWIEEIIDPSMEGQYNIREVEILVQVALKCVEEDRDARPTMRQVVEMLLSHENDS